MVLRNAGQKNRFIKHSLTSPYKAQIRGRLMMQPFPFSNLTYSAVFRLTARVHVAHAHQLSMISFILPRSAISSFE